MTDPIHWFRHSAPYINTHRGKTFVIVFGGRALADANFANLVNDIALLHSLGISLVLVYGSSPHDDALLDAGAVNTPASSPKPTSDAAMDHITRAVGQTRLVLEAGFSRGLPNSPMFGAKITTVSGNFVTAKPFGVRDGVDFGKTGEVRKIDTLAITQSLSQGHIVLMGSVGFSATGEMFYLEALDIATQTAVALHADKLIILGDARGILDDNANLIRELTTDAAAELPETYTLGHGIFACTHGVKRVHFLSFIQDGALLRELFTTDGCGTMLACVDYDQIRKATTADIIGIMALIRPLELQGVLVERSQERLEEELEYFFVIERDGCVIGCAALYPLAERCGELAGVAIDPNYRQGNRGANLLKVIENHAKALGYTELFALTTRTLHWFLEQGFCESSPHALPKSRQETWQNGRNAKVLVKSLLP